MVEQVMITKKRYEDMVAQFTEEQFKGWFIEFFKLYPFITKIEWTQYTPEYSDGDPCVFSVYEPEIALAASYIEGHKDVEVYGSDFEDMPLDGEAEPIKNILHTYRFKQSQAAKDPALIAAVKSIEELFKAEDVLRHVFGDDARVTATAKKIEVEGYDHD